MTKRVTMMVRHRPDKVGRRHMTLENRSLPNTLYLSAVAVLCVTSVIMVPPVRAQNPHHYFQRADMPPGSIGRAQLMRGGPLPGHFQAVEVSAPEGTHIALAMDGVFEPPQPAPLKAGLLVGHVYRLKVTNIPFREGQEVFPSIEIINRLYPPKGSPAKFPVPIELTREELEMALRGQYVVRVIYLEAPRSALPLYDPPEHQRYFDAAPGRDPLEVADSLGRPMAILRIGSRVPEMDQVTGRFLFQSPAWFRIPEMMSEAPDESPAATGAAGPTADNRGGLTVPPTTAERRRSNAGVNR